MQMTSLTNLSPKSGTLPVHLNMTLKPSLVWMPTQLEGVQIITLTKLNRKRGGGWPSFPNWTARCSSSYLTFGFPSFSYISDCSSYQVYQACLLNLWMPWWPITSIYLPVLNNHVSVFVSSISFTGIVFGTITLWSFWCGFVSVVLFVDRQFIVTDLPESSIAPCLSRLASKLGPVGIKLGSYPNLNTGQVTVSLIGPEPDQLANTALELEQEFSRLTKL